MKYIYNTKTIRMLGQMMQFPLLIPNLLEHGARVFPRQEIISYLPDQTIHRYTYADLHKRSKKLTYALSRKLGIGRGEMIGTFAWNHYQHLELYFGIPGAGAICHTINIRLSASQTEFIINNAEDRCLFVDASLVHLIEPIASALPSVKHYILLNAPAGFQCRLPGFIHYEELISDCPENEEWLCTDENEASGMCYTSGTTGLPKGVLYSHRSTCLHAIMVGLPNYGSLSLYDRLLVIVPQFHVMAWGIPYAGILSGSTLVMPSCLLQPDAIVRMIQEQTINKASGVPTIWQGVYAHMKKHDIRDLPLKEFLIGGASAPPSLIDHFQKDFGIEVIHAWGMTETSPVGTMSKLHPRHQSLPDKEKLNLRSKQGQTLPFTEIRIMTEQGEIAPWDGNTVGEIQIRGAWIIGSYFKTSMEDGFTKDGWFRTGDVGLMDEEGFLLITDRAKDLIKSGGEWISSVALEVTLMAHPLIREAAVIAIPDEVWTERPLAAIIWKDEDQTAGAEELRLFLSGSFAKYQLPDKFISLREIPKTSVGKFDKKRMRQLFAEGNLR